MDHLSLFFFSPPDERATEAAFTDALGAYIDPSTISAAAEVPMPVISVLVGTVFSIIGTKQGFCGEFDRLSCRFLVPCTLSLIAAHY